jgi:hypothetical protein
MGGYLGRKKDPEPGHQLMWESNIRAVDFYQQHGWRVHHEFPHERFGHMMFEMTKTTETLRLS